MQAATVAVGSRVKGQTLRLEPATWLKLKLLTSVLEAKRGARVTQRNLLLGAADDLLVKHRKDLPRDDG